MNAPNKIANVGCLAMIGWLNVHDYAIRGDHGCGNCCEDGKVAVTPETDVNPIAVVMRVVRDAGLPPRHNGKCIRSCVGFGPASHPMTIPRRNPRTLRSPLRSDVGKSLKYRRETYRIQESASYDGV